VRIGLAGLGLIGGSLALALRDIHEVVGYDVDERARSGAAGAGIRVADRLDDLGTADAVLVATPIAAIVPTLEELGRRRSDAVMIDTGSLKRGVARYAEHAPAAARIVGGHPMAGSTSSGFEAADPELFRGRPFLLVPTARSDDEAMSVAGGIARDAGAAVTVCSAEAHDRAMAILVAAPLATAAALAVAGAGAGALLGAAGPGFRDATRLAETPLELAADLLFGNADDAEAAIGAVIAALEQLRASLDRDDRAYAQDVLRTARDVRAKLA
jgi:prephenate dehydrogenase